MAYQVEESKAFYKRKFNVYNTMKIENIKNEISLLFDMKEVSKRSTQFIGFGVIVTGAMIPVHVYDGHYLSAKITFAFCIFLAGVWVMHKKKFTKYTTVISIVGINFFYRSSMS